MLRKSPCMFASSCCYIKKHADSIIEQIMFDSHAASPGLPDLYHTDKAVDLTTSAGTESLNLNVVADAVDEIRHLVEVCHHGST